MRVVIQRCKAASVALPNGFHSAPSPTPVPISKIGPGLLVLASFTTGDTNEDLKYCASKLISLKLWDDAASGKSWKHNIRNARYTTGKNDVGSIGDSRMELLVVSQFTLYGTISKNNQPDFKNAMKSIEALESYKLFVTMCKILGLPQNGNEKKDKKRFEELLILSGSGKNDDEGGIDEVVKKEGGVNVEIGAFGEFMEVMINGDGPVTIIVDSKDKIEKDKEKEEEGVV